jgi:hypothetical protein
MLVPGFTPDDIGKVGGGNFGRVLGKVTAGYAWRNQNFLLA